MDEAGDGVLFSAKGQVLIGKAGCSQFFVLGAISLADEVAVTRELSELRKRLLNDLYFKDVPSMQLKAGKTAVAFHAKDDLAEIRRDVFNVLVRHPAKFCAVVREKAKVLEYVRQRNEQDPTYRYRQNELYDSLVRRLFKNLLHKDEGYRIFFAKRGGSDRTAALQTALLQARERFTQEKRIVADAPIQVQAATPEICAALQVVDYYLWALQRLFEKGDDRFVCFLSASFSLVHDVDDTRTNQYGEYYDKRRPLSKVALEGRPRI